MKIHYCRICDLFFFFKKNQKTKLFRFYSPTSPRSSPCLLLCPLLHPQRQRKASLASSAVIAWEERSAGPAGPALPSAGVPELGLPFKTGFAITDSHIAVLPASCCTTGGSALSSAGARWMRWAPPTEMTRSQCQGPLVSPWP